jgi:hypothetical protein
VATPKVLAKDSISWRLNLIDPWGLQQMESQAPIQTENVMLAILFGIN